MTQTIRLLLGDSFQRIAELEPGSVVSIVADPPYGISFMSKVWDKPTLDPTSDPLDEEDAPTTAEINSFQTWALGWLQLCFDKLPPGGVIKIFGATRTFHRMAAAMEKVGFEKPCIEAWIQGQGFPKSLDIAKAIGRLRGEGSPEALIYAGWGTALKPSWEPFLVGRKP